MKFIVAGGNSPLKLVNDLKVRIAFNRFSGDSIVKTVFPSTITNSDGDYEAVMNFAGTGNSNDILKSVVVESEKLGYVVYVSVVLVVVFIIWMFAKK